MGLFDRFFGGGEGTERTTQVRLAGDLRADRIDVHVGETRFRCSFETNGSWVAATGGAGGDEADHRLFLFDLETGVRYVMNLTDPQALTLSADGTVALADERARDQDDETTFFVLDDRGTVLVEHPFDEPPGSVALTDDGRYAAIGTRDGTTAVFGLPEGEMVAEQDAEPSPSRGLRFRRDGDRWALVLQGAGDAPRGGEGEVLWRSPT